MDIVHAGENPLRITQSFVQALDSISSGYAKAILDIYREEKNKLQEHYMGASLADDCIPIYLAFPEQFGRKEIPAATGKAEIRPFPGKEYGQYILSLLDSDRKADKSIIFKSFPELPGFFEDDVSPSVEKIIQKYGSKEWKIIVLTNEFHEHLGIYSIIGAKMGLRAREYFRVGVDEVAVKSYAGHLPPLSCLNDGLQVSTGATLGHGTITVVDTDPAPSAEFIFKNTTITLDLKQSIKARIRNDVQSAIERYGMDTPEYWNAIRKQAIRYWLELDRREIFEIYTDQASSTTSNPISAAILYTGFLRSPKNVTRCHPHWSQ
jgi:pyrimidine-specific ribonucleoside hydrolase